MHELLLSALCLCVFYCVIRIKDGQLMSTPTGLRPVPRPEWRRSDRTPFKSLLLPFSLVSLWLLVGWQLSLGLLWTEPMVGSGCQALSAMTVLKATRNYRTYTARHLRRFAERAVYCLCIAFWLWATDAMACRDVHSWSKSHELPYPHPRAWCYCFVALGLHSAAVWLLLVRSELTGTPLPESIMRRNDEQRGCRLAAWLLGVAGDEYDQVGVVETDENEAADTVAESQPPPPQQQQPRTLAKKKKEKKKEK